MDTDPTKLQRSVVVPVPVEQAFAAFTGRFSEIKPPEHNMLGTPIAETVIEPHVGGGIVDRGTDGSEFTWARVLAFDPPTRLSFSWLLSPTWQLETDDANASEVEVRFVPEGPERTRVEIEHRHLDRHGPGWEAVRDGVGDDQGWPLYLERFRGLLVTA